MELDLLFAGQALIRLVGVSLAAAAGLALLGYVPTVRLAGREAVGEMLSGIGISLLAGIMGAIPVARSISSHDPQQVPIGILASTAVRFIVVLALAAPAALSGWFDRGPMLLWVGISYLVMLAVDSIYAVRLIKAGQHEQT